MKPKLHNAPWARTAPLTSLHIFLLVAGLILPVAVPARDAEGTKAPSSVPAFSAERATPAAAATQTVALPDLKVEKGRYGTYVTIRYDAIPGLVLNIWCYELGPGEPISHEQQGKAVVLAHKLGEAKLLSRFEPCPDGVDIGVKVTAPDAKAVRAVRSLNPCCLFQNSPAFKGTEDYVGDFVARCFVFLDGGMTSLKDTKRLPSTLPGGDPRAKLPQPWIQEYIPAWRKHPGSGGEIRATSTDRPVYPIIGVISCDGKHLAAIAWPDTKGLGQVWHHCFHPRPDLNASFNPATGEIYSRGKIYLMENDKQRLLERFKHDFPNWRRPPDQK